MTNLRLVFSLDDDSTSGPFMVCGAMAGVREISNITSLHEALLAEVTAQTEKKTSVVAIFCGLLSIHSGDNRTAGYLFNESDVIAVTSESEAHFRILNGEYNAYVPVEETVSIEDMIGDQLASKLKGGSIFVNVGIATTDYNTDWEYVGGKLMEKNYD